MKAIFAVSALAVLSACSEWTPEQKSAAVALTVAYVQDMDLAKPLDAKDRARLAFVCDLSVIQYPEYADTIVLACDAAKGEAA